MTVRVLHVLDTRQLRGAEVFAADLIRALNGTGVSQRVGVLHDRGGERVRFEAPEQLLGADGWMAPGLRIHPQAVRTLRRLVEEWRPHVIQAHGGSTLKYTVPALIGLPARVVYRQIGPTPPEMISPFRRAGHRLLMGRADRVVAVGDAVRRNAVELFRVPPENVVTIPNAVDPIRIKAEKSREATRQALGIAPRAPVILSLGALTWEKDPLAHVEIGAQVLRQRPEAVHLLVGDGPLQSSVQIAINQLGLDDRMRVLPARGDAPDLLAMSDLLLLASRIESMTACVIEAGMLGVPTAAYSVGGVPEVVVQGVTGRLTRAGDTDGLAECVLDLFENPITARAMGEAARERYHSLFDIAMIAPRYLHLYKELLDS